MLSALVVWRYKLNVLMEEFDIDKVHPNEENRLILRFHDWSGGVEVPLTETKFENLKTLDLSYNSIQHLPDSITNLLLLKELYVHHNSLRYIPEEIGQLRHLTKLHINDNKLEVLPSSITSCIKLRELMMQNNCLQELPVDLFGNRYNIEEYHQTFQIDVRENPFLNMIPKLLAFQDDACHSNAVLWLLNIHHNHLIHTEQLNTATIDAKEAIDEIEEKMEYMKSKRDSLVREKNKLLLHIERIEDEAKSKRGMRIKNWLCGKILCARKHVGISQVLQDPENHFCSV